ncbi:MAG: ArnT family glycosyltransferase [Bacteroidota bacterium]
MAEDFCIVPACANEYTRGHPLLFHALGGLWIKIFGNNFVSLRSFAFFITITLQYSCFFVGCKLFNPRSGFYISSILLLQNIIFAQAIFLFPEIFLALTAIWTFYFYLKKKTTGYLISAFLLCLIKEQGSLLLLSFFLWEIVSNVRNYGFKFYLNINELFKLSLLIIPSIGIVVFLLLQKVQKGYWFYPEHINLISLDLKHSGYQFKTALKLLTTESGRYIISFLFVVCFLIYGKIKPTATRILMLIMAFTSLEIVSIKWDIPIPVLIIIIIPIVFLVLYRFIFADEEQGIKLPYIGPSLFFIFVYLAFCSFNFFTDRYLAMVLPFLVLIFVGLTDHWISSNWTKNILFISIIFLSTFNLRNLNGFGDTSPKNYQMIRLHQKIINYALTSHWEKKNILTTFIMKNNMVNVSSGYVKKNQVFENTTNIYLNHMPKPEYVIFFPYEIDKNINSFVQSNNCKKLIEIKFEDAIALIYKVQP